MPYAIRILILYLSHSYKLEAGTMPGALACLVQGDKGMQRILENGDVCGGCSCHIL